MLLQNLKTRLQESNLYHVEAAIMNTHSVVGYEKKFKWSWMATQLNTFIVATDFGDQEIDVPMIQQHLRESFQFAERNYTGWPRGLQSGIGVISILISSQLTPEAKDFCLQLKSGKKFAAFTIPVVADSTTNEMFYFRSNPMWGRIYFPHFKRTLEYLRS